MSMLGSAEAAFWPDILREQRENMEARRKEIIDAVTEADSRIREDMSDAQRAEYDVKLAEDVTLVAQTDRPVAQLVREKSMWFK